MRLIDALRVDKNSRISVVGAGGKSSIVIRLANEWEGKSITAATAHMGWKQIKFYEKHYIWEPRDFSTQTIKVESENIIITGPEIDCETVHGIDPSLWKNLYILSKANNVPLFLESDGSRTRPLKAPAEHEPPIPEWVNHVVVCVGLSVLGKPLTEEFVHRPELFSNITGIKIGKPVTLDGIIKLLVHPLGGYKNIPENSKKTIVFNQIDTIVEKSSLLVLEKDLNEQFDAIIFASLQGGFQEFKAVERPLEVEKIVEKTGGVILAAGDSSRMGTSKSLLQWEGQPFVRVCALEALAAGLIPICIIAGADYESIKICVSDLPVNVIWNSNWKKGLSCSIREGILSMPVFTGSVIFQLVDQPQINSLLIRELINEHSQTLSPIILPMAGGRRGNPSLFDRNTFQDLLQLEGDIGGRAIFSKYPVKLLPWNDDSILMDVDTPDDYRKLVERFKI
jgi:molybdenum cofactor cytidylyltransferase